MYEMVRWNRRRSGLAAIALSGVSVGQVRAQTLDQFISPDIGGVAREAGVTVLSRRRPDYEAPGVRLGSFIVRPTLAESAGYESNVLGTSRPHGSPVIETNAAIEAVSDVSRVNLAAALTVDDVRYTDQPSQSFTNWTARIGGSYDIGRDTASVQYSHMNLNQTARDLDVPQGLNQSLSYAVDTVRLSYRAAFNRVALTPTLDVSNYDYSNGSASGSTYRQDYRDRILVSPSLTAAYELAPRRNVVVVVRDSVASYRTQASGLPRRDYNDLAVLTGLDLDAAALVRFRGLVGYEVRTFQSAQYKTIQAPVAELSVVWTPTGLTTLTGTLARQIQDSADETTAGYAATSFRLRADHEYRRNILLQANGGVYLNEYSRGGGDQTLVAVGTGATYLLNRNAALSATYDFSSRTGSGGNPQQLGGTGTFHSFGSSYVDNRLMLQLRLSL